MTPILSQIDGEALQFKIGAPKVLADALQNSSESRSQKGLYFIQSDGSEVRKRYGEVLEQAYEILGGLQANGCRPGTNVLLQFDRNEDFIPTFWACMLGGFIATPLELPQSFDVNS